MKKIFALIVGAVSGVAAVLLHQTLPPLGVILSIAVTYLTIWVIGRVYGRRSLKFLALVGWFLVIFRASTFGSGHELLIFVDGLGATLLLGGFAAGIIATAKKI